MIARIMGLKTVAPETSRAANAMIVTKATSIRPGAAVSDADIAREAKEEVSLAGTIRWAGGTAELRFLPAEHRKPKLISIIDYY
jgi:hypothetical protein